MWLPGIGELSALLAALCWAIALVLFKRSVATVSPLHLNVFKNLVGLLLIGLTLAIQYGLLIGRGDDLSAYHLTGHDWFVLIFSGVLGVALADTLLFYALDLVGVSLMSVVDCIYAPSVILLGALYLGEDITPLLWVGTGLVLSGIFISSRHAPPADRTRGQLLAGMLLGAAAIFCIAFAIVYCKPVLEKTPVIWATAIRMSAAMVPLVIVALLRSDRGTMLRLCRPGRIWRLVIPASIFGNYLSLILWVAGFKYADAAINGVLNQTSVIFALILAAIFLHEPLTRRKVTAISLAMVGALVVLYDDELLAWMNP